MTIDQLLEQIARSLGEYEASNLGRKGILGCIVETEDIGWYEWNGSIMEARRKEDTNG